MDWIETLVNLARFAYRHPWQAPGVLLAYWTVIRFASRFKGHQ